MNAEVPLADVSRGVALALSASASVISPAGSPPLELGNSTRRAGVSHMPLRIG